MAKYTGVSISGYNATPPSDDGTVSESNKVKWSTEKTKLTDPLKTAIESINTNLVSAFDVGPTSLVTNTTLGTSHYGDFIQTSGVGVTHTLTDAATLGAGWHCEIVNTDSTNTVTIGRATGDDTINGTAANISLLPYQAISVFVNAAANGFIATAKRTHSKGERLESSIWMAEGANVASANDCNIWTTDGNTVHITGTTTITDWGTAPQAGAWKWIIFDDAMQLTYNATTNKLNTNGANYTTVAGDRALIYAEATDSYVVTVFNLSGFPISAPTAGQGSSLVLIGSETANNSSSIDFASGITSEYEHYIVDIVNAVPATDDVYIALRVSTDGGSSFLAGASDYRYGVQTFTTGGGTNTSNGTVSLMPLVSGTGTFGIDNATANGGYSGHIHMWNPSATVRHIFHYDGVHEGSGAVSSMRTYGSGAYTGSTTAINAIRLFMSSGNITSGSFYIYGVKKA